jgi:predicted O-methyltransferase YrrM
MSIEEALVEQALGRTLSHGSARIALLGLTPLALTVRAQLESAGLGDRLLGIFDPAVLEGGAGQARPWSELLEGSPDLLVVCSDAGKEELLRAYHVGFGDGLQPPEVILAGIAHLTFQNSLYEELDAPALVPSYATGYANTRVHLFQCLQAAAANRLHGAVVEFGAFKGGTTAWLARSVHRLGLEVPVIGFDSWSGFPPRHSVLDLYTHPRCVFTDLDAVRAHLEPLGVELVVGDITETAKVRLSDEPVLLAFVDTDNYSPAKAALEAVLPNLVAGGSIVFDHYETTPDYVYTLGERMAAQEVLADAGLLQLHGTGVFVKLAG